MPENFSAGQFLRKADKCFGVFKVNKSMQYQYFTLHTKQGGGARKTVLGISEAS
jgi:hypothetical protein